MNIRVLRHYAHGRIQKFHHNICALLVAKFDKNCDYETWQDPTPKQYSKLIMFSSFYSKFTKQHKFVDKTKLNAKARLPAELQVE